MAQYNTKGENVIDHQDEVNLIGYQIPNNDDIIVGH